MKVVAPSGLPPTALPQPIVNEQVLSMFETLGVRRSFDGMDRLHHAHGHTAMEIYQLRYGWPKDFRLPDVVVWPSSHEHVCKIVATCQEHDVCIIPYGGGTSVTYGLIPPKNEKRMIISLDMHEMDKIKWVDKNNLTACIEAGIQGKNLQEKLAAMGLTLGHEPDSAEFSTLGGWISTRASGMKKNLYGNIEDLLVSVCMVTPKGILHRDTMVPRLSSGPDINQIILGSEGTLGVITEAVLKLRPLPECQIFGAVIFPTFSDGVKFMREVAFYRAQPASIRLVDNEQFKFGHALKPKVVGLGNVMMDVIKKAYVTKWHGIDLGQLSACTLLFEGTPDLVKAQQAKVYALAKLHNGVKADAENGKRGYSLTFMIAYLRDFGFQVGLISESFETSVPWSKALVLCNRVKERVKRKARDLLVSGEPFTSCRVTQVYDTGCCIYFYIAIQFQGLPDPVHTFSELEHAAREEILECGGSISHHHGVGKHRTCFLPQTIGNVGLDTLKAIKNELDPKNIFAVGNFFELVSE
eukprot:TRINITY_DN5054_c0_g1_i12.p1 TRINITY_DN5054_c0_g1~~TRINITY_DN5054_c0_g1_i12.p1  ORF type:complete len:525 (-),score=106.40 TRINITY_DN5054_c0_g1_i12:119-1693(-)